MSLRSLLDITIIMGHSIVSLIIVILDWIDLCHYTLASTSGWYKTFISPLIGCWALSIGSHLERHAEAVGLVYMICLVLALGYIPYACYIKYKYEHQAVFYPFIRIEMLKSPPAG